MRRKFCANWTDCGLTGGGCCALGRGGGKPSFTYCALVCDILTDGERAIAQRLAVLQRQPAPQPRVFRPGDAISQVLSRLGYTATAGCGCEAMRRTMNAWGWWGCAITHRAEIVTWFQAKAREAGIEVDGRGVLGLLRAAWRDARRRHTPDSSGSDRPAREG